MSGALGVVEMLDSDPILVLDWIRLIDGRR